MRTTIYKTNILLVLFLVFSCKNDDNGGGMPPEATPPPMDPVLLVQDLTQSVPENQGVATVVAQFAITQENLTDPLTFELLEVSRSGAVTVNNEGQLLVEDALAFDFERQEIISGQVRASSGELSQTAMFTLNLLNVDEPFITLWNLTGGNLTVQLPLYEGTVEDPTAYNFTVVWGDGTTGEITSFDDPDARHTYATEGNKLVTIAGTLRGFSFGENEASREQLVDVTQWGDMRLGNSGGQFRRCTNLATFSATDTPILTEVTNVSLMFEQATAFNGDISSWDVSNITNMNFMFVGATAFNGDISNWDVSNVSTMAAMFFGASVFNGNISSWNVSNVTNMLQMFNLASVFNQDISNWDVANVNNMTFMFSDATAFNQDLSNWDVANVTDMSRMFQRASAFNQDLSSWNVANVTNMNSMFTGASVFSQNLSNWATDNVTECENFANGSMLTAEQLPTQGICF